MVIVAKVVERAMFRCWFKKTHGRGSIYFIRSKSYIYLAAKDTYKYNDFVIYIFAGVFFG
jgi:hypothetical protein